MKSMIDIYTHSTITQPTKAGLAATQGIMAPAVFTSTLRCMAVVLYCAVATMFLSVLAMGSSSVVDDRPTDVEGSRPHGQHLRVPNACSDTEGKACNQLIMMPATKSSEALFHCVGQTSQMETHRSTSSKDPETWAYEGKCLTSVCYSGSV